MSQNRYASTEFQQVAMREIGYFAEAKRCRDCAHYDTVEVEDRSWVPSCKLFLGTAGFIRISEHGSCRRWEKKR